MITDNFCCIGAELQKREFSEYSSPQIYYYRSASDEETLEVMLSDNFFNPINEKVNKDDIIFIYSIEEKMLTWVKVISNQGGIVRIESVRINGSSVRISIDEFKTITEGNLQDAMSIVDNYISKIIPMLDMFGARTNIFEMSTDLQPLNQDVLGQKQYTNIATDKFTRIPVKTYEEDNENIEQDTLDFQFLQVGSLVVDTFGTLGIVEVLQNDGVEYTNISITTLIMGNTANKTTDFISPINDTNKGLTNNEANTSVSANNKIATMTEINAITNGNYLGKSYWFGKTTAGFVVPTPTISKQNYIDFTTNEIYVAKEDLSGWDLQETITPQNTEMILITSSFWDIPENGYPGTAIYSNTTSWSYFPRKAGRGDNITITEKQPDGALTVVKDYFGFRKENTAYELGDKVSCAYHPDLMLECGVAGTTSNIELDTRGELSTGDTITDGTVVWKVEELGGASNALRTTQITNCITEIPQDIKLELNNGTLNLKAGSKVYVPNGFEADGTTPKFDEVIISNDKPVEFQSWGSDTREFFYNPTTDNFTGNILTYTTSGSSASQSKSTWVWYDTINNLVKRTEDSGSTWESGWSLPICICANVQNTSSSIDQVFNGFGYIGSTAFALPGVKGLIPDGRNADGSLKNIEFVYEKVITRTFTGTSPNSKLLFKPSAITEGSSAQYFPKTNKNDYGYANEDGVFVIVGSMSISSGVISNFNPQTTFQAIDRNDSSWLSGLGMPSSKYIDLSLGASDSLYTAPANGWFTFSKKAVSVGQYLQMNHNSNAMRSRCDAASSSSLLSVYMPVLKGQQVRVVYVATGNTETFRFVYAEGDNI